jgi:hypothetical protein
VGASGASLHFGPGYSQGVALRLPLGANVFVMKPLGFLIGQLDRRPGPVCKSLVHARIIRRDWASAYVTAFRFRKCAKRALASKPTTPVKSKAIDAGSGTTLAKVVPTRSSSKLKAPGPET